jgi:hypothetical protein
MVTAWRGKEKGWRGEYCLPLLLGGGDGAREKYALVGNVLSCETELNNDFSGYLN